LLATGAANLPVLKAGESVLNNQFTQVDQFTAATKGVATLFVRHGDDFFRVSTSLRNPQGERVIGTVLDSKHPAYAKLMANQRYVGPAKLFGRSYMTQYQPIADASGKVVAASFIGLDFTEGLQALKTSVRALKIGAHGYPFVLDAGKEAGLAIIHPASEGKNIIDLRDKNGLEVVRRLIEMKSGELRYWWQNEALGEKAPREKVAVVMPFEKWGWVVATSAYVDELSEEVSVVRQHLALTGGAIIAILALAILWATHRWITQPLSQAVAVTQKIAAGDLTQHIEASSQDEVGTLLNALDDMGRHLRQLVKEIDAGMSNLTSNAHQLAGAADAVANSSGEQSQAATTMAATVEEMTASISQVALHADACREMAEQSGAVSDSGIEVIHRAVNSMNGIAQTVADSSVAVATLGNESQQISHIVNVIREIADQTNLLALNAAIEAARAGEAGRGFAVVADEVRKLAERTTLSTQEITGMVDRIQHGAGDAVTRMHAGERQVSDGVQLANEASGRIAQIKSSADDVSAAVVGISDALREQSAANQQIAMNVEQIAVQAEQNYQQARTTSETALSMEVLSQQLKASIARFRT